LCLCFGFFLATNVIAKLIVPAFPAITFFHNAQCAWLRHRFLSLLGSFFFKKTNPYGYQ